MGAAGGAVFMIADFQASRNWLFSASVNNLPPSSLKKLVGGLAIHQIFERGIPQGGIDGIGGPILPARPEPRVFSPRD